MRDLAKYALSPLRGGDLPLHRGARDGQSPILVIAVQEQTASVEAVRRLEHEYALRDELDIAWAARPLALSRGGDRISLVLEDPGGEPLDTLCGGPWTISDFLNVAIPLAAALRGAHDRGLVHHDVKPANILADLAGGGVWLTGFGVATRSPRELPGPDPPELIAGTLAYMAPEQTGRMNRSTDARSDLYGLGVTLYELLTGAPPFAADDAMELIHCHIAQPPAPPGDRVPAIPAQLSAIVLKLLAKTPEARYQTAAGLEADLRHCLALYEADGRIEPFPLAARDAADRLAIPEKLYGRDGEIAMLVEAFDRVAALGRTGVVLVSGESGVGKSSLVDELRKALASRHGLYACGKFDQYLRDVPYATLAQAFQSLVRSLLGRSEAELGPWRDALGEALGPNGQLIAYLVPQLEAVIGNQPPVPELPPSAAQRRFQMVFRRFLGVFASLAHPLVLFLDDLQWMDRATLELVEHLAAHPEVKGLLLVGAYRTGDVGAAHPLARSIGSMRASDADVLEIALGPLSIEDLEQLAGDALRCEPHRARPLAELVCEKTAGNPFFAVQFLASLVQEDLLAFDAAAAAWRWDIDRIRAKSCSDNVVDLMTEKLGRLSDPARNVLTQLACLGATAELSTLALVTGQAPQDTSSVLEEAVDARLVIRREKSLSFLHDRIQQAAYSLVPEERRAEIHAGIGRALIAGLGPGELDEQVFEVASHLNRGADQFVDPDEKGQVAKLNLHAGRKAKASAAFATASAYLAAGAALLGEDGWESRYDVRFQLQLERAECEFLLGGYDEAERLIGGLIEHAASKPDLAAAYFLAVQLHVVNSDLARAVDCGLTCLRAFDIVFPAHPTSDEVQAEYAELSRQLAGRSIESLIDLPLMTDPDLQAAMRLLSNVFDAFMFFDFNLGCLHRCRMVNISLRHGMSGAAAQACGFHGATIGPAFHRYSEGYRFARLACDLVARHGFAADEPRADLAMGMAAFWTQPIGTVVDVIRAARRTTTAAGDFTPACYSYPQMISARLFRNDPLDAVWQETEKGLAFTRTAGFRDVADHIVSQQRFIANMQGRTSGFSTFDDDQFDERTFEARLGDRPASAYWILKLKACFISGRYADALAAARQAEARATSSPWIPAFFDYVAYAALTLAALYDDAPDEARSEWRGLLEAHLAQLSEWAGLNPPTFGDKRALVAAEIARIEGRDADAMGLYEQAIRSARENQFVQNEGLALEVAARFYAARGLETIAEAHLRAARRCYLRWGAEGKVRQLEQLHPRLRQAAGPAAQGITAGAAIGRLDAETVVRASQALSSEIRLGELIEKLMRITLEHAGADRGLLILPREGAMRVLAVAVTGAQGVDVGVDERDVVACDLPLSVLNYVVRTRDVVALDDATAPNPYQDDTYVVESGVRSVLCVPIGSQASAIGAFYLENRLTPFAFTSDRVAVLKMLASQAAISLENARLYCDLQRENNDRKRAQEELRRSEGHLQEAQALGRMGSFVLDTAARRYVGSPEFYRIFLGTDREVESVSLGRFAGYIHPEDREAVEAQRNQAIAAQIPWKYAYKLLLPDGSIKFVESVAHPLLDEAGAVIEYVGAIIDVTERKLAEQQLRNAEEAFRRAQADLAHASRVSTMGELTAALAHEVNQPIMAAITNASACLRLLTGETPDIEEAREAAMAIISAGTRAAEIVSRTRALFKKDAPQREPLDVAEMVRDTLFLLEGEARQYAIKARTQLAPGLPQVMGDRIQLQQVIMNLVVNSIDAMKAQRGERELTVGARLTDDGEVAVAVSDTGPGLPTEGTQKIFDAFFTTKPDGTGMGLSISRSIVQAHGGHLRASPNAPRGAVFEFTLPVALSPSADQSSAAMAR